MLSRKGGLANLPIRAEPEGELPNHDEYIISCQKSTVVLCYTATWVSGLNHPESDRPAQGPMLLGWPTCTWQLTVTST